MTPREIVHTAVAVIAEQPFTDATPLRDLTDSLGLVEIGAEIENHVTLPADAEFEAETVGDLVATVERMERVGVQVFVYPPGAER